MMQIKMTIKNERFNALVTRESSRQKTWLNGNQDVIDLLLERDITDEEVCEAFIYPFAIDVAQCAAERDKPLDFTYETLCNLPYGLQGVFLDYQKQGLSFYDNCNATEKSFAAYMLLLAINEHDCQLKGENVNSILNQAKENSDRIWMNTLRILTGVRREMDFLKLIADNLNILQFGQKKFVSFSVAPFIREYRAAFRVDLAKCGLTDIAFDGY